MLAVEIKRGRHVVLKMIERRTAIIESDPVRPDAVIAKALFKTAVDDSLAVTSGEGGSRGERDGKREHCYAEERAEWSYRLKDFLHDCLHNESVVI